MYAVIAFCTELCVFYGCVRARVSNLTVISGSVFVFCVELFVCERGFDIGIVCSLFLFRSEKEYVSSLNSSIGGAVSERRKVSV